MHVHVWSICACVLCMCGVHTVHVLVHVSKCTTLAGGIVDTKPSVRLGQPSTSTVNTQTILTQHTSTVQRQRAAGAC